MFRLFSFLYICVYMACAEIKYIIIIRIVLVKSSSPMSACENQLKIFRSALSLITALCFMYFAPHLPIFHSAQQFLFGISSVQRNKFLTLVRCNLPRALFLKPAQPRRGFSMKHIL